MEEKGTCLKHGEFNLKEGCPHCLAEQRDKAQEGLLDKISTLPLVTEVEINPPETAVISIKPETNQAIIKLYDEAVKIQRYAETRVIKTIEDTKAATDDLSVISRLKKAIEEKRKEYVGPINEHLKAVNDAFKTFTEPLNQADSITRQKLLDYRKEQERIRQEQERINQLRIDAAKAEMELKGELAESVELVEVQPEAPRRISTDMGMAGMRDNWKYEIISFVDLPDEYKVPDTAMLNSIAKKYHDQKTIPGVRFYNEPILAVTTK